MSKNVFTPDGGPHRTSRVLDVSDGLKRIGEFEAAEMLAGYAALLRERESAKAVVAWQVRSRRMRNEWSGWKFYEYEERPESIGQFEFEYRPLYAKLPMLASARVPEELVVVDEVGRIEFDSTGQLDVNWSIEGGPNGVGAGAILLVADRKITDDEGYGEVYTAAPKPEKE